MAVQISLKLSEKMFSSAKYYAESRGFDTLQDLIRELLREKLFENEAIGGRFTSIASEASLAKLWNTKEEDKAWAHLQKVT
ncbi:MAG TPA: hypothetical protein VJB66_05705 [Candidatus Nanoarchaeia archaeon]|nr:hypothetical protein [Candidatus Nanoarchaeia archaeon]